MSDSSRRDGRRSASTDDEMNDLIIGQEYEVSDQDELPPGTGEPESVVPVGYDDTGNLQVDHFPPNKTYLWNEEGVRELIDRGVLVHA